MKFLAVFAVLATAATASPVNEARQAVYTPCTSGSLYSNPQCCATDVLNILALDCNQPAANPVSAASFSAVCALSGMAPKCCAIPVAGQALLCQDPVGISS